MKINLTDPANHPANGRLTDERLIRVRDELQRMLTYKNGSTQDYVTADAIKALDGLLQRRNKRCSWCGRNVGKGPAG